jgi:hypothetical protein
MALLDFTIQLSRTNELLTRIADALDRAVPQLPDSRLGIYKRGPESLRTYGDNEKTWIKEELYNLVHPQGLAPALEQELMDRALSEYDEGIPVEVER